MASIADSIARKAESMARKLESISNQVAEPPTGTAVEREPPRQAAPAPPSRQPPTPHYSGESVPNTAPPPQLPPRTPTASTNTASTTTNTKDPPPSLATLTTVFREARHLAGGLVHHPHESTRHFTILRHSTGLVYYHGPSTSLAVTIFSSPTHPLPTDRTFWLQPKGWLGKAGWRAKSLAGLDGDWLDVTPATRVDAAQLDPGDERAWQRDIKHFVKKGPKGHSRGHVVRETAVVRIPVEATDGYFRLVLCSGRPTSQGGSGKKTLCPSPAFRVASSSASPSSVRGASLGNLPLELGAMALSAVTKAHVSTFTETLTQPALSVVEPYQPGAIASEALSAGYGASGLEDRVAGAQDAYTQTRDASYDPLAGDAADDANAAVTPLAPYPIVVTSVVVPGTGASAAMTGLPTANLKAVRDDLAHRLNGYYFAWARVVPAKKPGADGIPVETTWYPAIFSSLPAQTSGSASVVMGIKKAAAVYLLHDFGQGVSLVGATLEILVLGFLRPSAGESASAETPGSAPQPQSPEERQEAALLAAIDDVELTNAALARPGWRIEDLLDPKTGKLIPESERAQRGSEMTAGGAQEQQNSGAGGGGGLRHAWTAPASQGKGTARGPPGAAPPDQQPQQQQQQRASTFGADNITGGLTDAYVGARQGVQRQFDKVPFHRVGIRVGVDGLRDKSIGPGGVYVVRG